MSYLTGWTLKSGRIIHSATLKLGQIIAENQNLPAKPLKFHSISSGPHALLRVNFCWWYNLKNNLEIIYQPFEQLSF